MGDWHLFDSISDNILMNFIFSKSNDRYVTWNDCFYNYLYIMMGTIYYITTSIIMIPMRVLLAVLAVPGSIICFIIEKLSGLIGNK